MTCQTCESPTRCFFVAEKPLAANPDIGFYWNDEEMGLPNRVTDIRCDDDS